MRSTQRVRATSRFSPRVVSVSTPWTTYGTLRRPLRVIDRGPSSPFRQGVVSDVLDDLLSVRPLHPVDELLHVPGGLPGRVEEEETRQRVRSALRGIERGGDGGRAV